METPKLSTDYYGIRRNQAGIVKKEYPLTLPRDAYYIGCPKGELDLVDEEERSSRVFTSKLQGLPSVLSQETVVASVKFFTTSQQKGRTSLKQEVKGLLEKAGKPNWDGEDALAVTPKTVSIAQKLIDKFPLTQIGKPDVNATPHGEVDFDWFVDRDAMLTVSVSLSGEIAFAGLFGKAQIHNSEKWEGALPELLDCCFEQLRKVQAL